MTYAQLKRRMSAYTRGHVRKADRMLKLLAGTILDECKAGRSVSIPGLGVFRRGTRKARHITNPRTGERMALPEMATLKFTAAKAAKERVR